MLSFNEHGMGQRGNHGKRGIADEILLLLLLLLAVAGNSFHTGLKNQ